MISKDEELKKLEIEILKLSNQYFDAKFKETPFIPGISNVPVSGKVTNSLDLENLIKASLEMWLTTGNFSDIFEKNLARFVNVRHSLFVNSGSSANLLALSSLKILYGLEDGDEVITSAVNFPTTLNPIIQNNLKPILVDVDLTTFNINADLIEERITNKTKGIVLAHTLGNPFEIEKIVDICKKYNLFLMEDMCDALGSKYDNKMVGTFGDVATLSFYPAHHITTGEGGAVLTNNTKLKKIMLSMRDWGRDCYCKPGEDNTCKKRYDWQLGGLPHGYDHKYTYSNIGYNLKATDLQAAIGISQLEKVDSFIKKRKENFQFLFNNFSKFESFYLPKTSIKAETSWFGFPLTIKENVKFDRRELLNFYAERRIGTRLVFAGNILLQPAYCNLKIGNPKDFPNSNIVANNSFWLGVYPGLKIEMLQYIVDSTEEFLNEYN